MQRLLALVLLLAAGMVSLPLAALALDDKGTENWILPTQLGAMAVLGAVVALVLPGLLPDRLTTGSRVLFGAVIGVAAAGLGVLVFFVLLTGFENA